MATHRRFASESSAPVRRPRPLSILSPPSSPVPKYTERLPEHFEEIVLELESKKQKVYYEGYLLKLEEQHATHTPRLEGWESMYASLSGTVLSVWPAADLDLAETLGSQTRVAPKYINLMDARLTQDKSGDVVITTTGNRTIKLRGSGGTDTSDSRRWLLAVRLSAFERARMQEAYTANLFLKYSIKDTTTTTNKEERWSGFVDARFSGSDVAKTQWTRLWCSVVTSSNFSLLHRLAAPESKHGDQEIKFFANRKDKTPVYSLLNVFAAYACYPEHLSLIEKSGMIKVEGDVRTAASKPAAPSNGFALFIPVPAETSKRLSLSSNSQKQPTLVQNILKLLHAIWLTFGLYNLPKKLLLNSDHADALGMSKTRLDMKIDQLEGKIPSNCRTDYQWGQILREQANLQSHYEQVEPTPSVDKQTEKRHIFRRIGKERRVVSESAIRTPSSRSSVTTFENDALFHAKPMRPLVTEIEEDQTITKRSSRPLLTTLEEDSFTEGQSYGKQLVTSIEEDEALEQKKVAVSPGAAQYSYLLPRVELVGTGSQSLQPASSGQAVSFARLDSPSAGLPANTGAGYRDVRSTQHVTGATSSGASTTGPLSLARSPTSETFASSLNGDVKSLHPVRSRKPIEDSDEEDLFARPHRTPRSGEGTYSMTTTEGSQSAASAAAAAARPVNTLRHASYDSFLSEVSESSTYSAGIDPAAFDLVSRYFAASDSRDKMSRVPSQDREGSVYSAKVGDADDASDYASTVGEDERAAVTTQVDKRLVDGPVERLGRRADAVEVLGIKRHSSVKVPLASAVDNNPYVRPRQRGSPQYSADRQAMERVNGDGAWGM